MYRFAQKIYFICQQIIHWALSGQVLILLKGWLHHVPSLLRNGQGFPAAAAVKSPAAQLTFKTSDPLSQMFISLILYRDPLHRRAGATQDACCPAASPPFFSILILLCHPPWNSPRALAIATILITAIVLLLIIYLLY